MPKRIRLPLAALFLAAPTALSAQSTRDFQLPPAPTPTASPQVQGPVDSEGSTVPARPRVIPTATPTPVATPAPTATANPGATVQPLPTRTPTPSTTGPAATTPRSVAPSGVPTSRPTIAPARPPVSAPDSDAALRQPGAEQALPQGDLPAPVIEAPVQPQPEASVQPGWLWPAVGGGILALLGLGYFASRRRKNAEPPQIERPIVAPAGAGMVAPADLQLRAEAIKLTRSVMNATLHYRVTLLNRSGSALSHVALGADVVSAHGGVPVEQQVANSSQLLEKRHTFDRIAPGQSVRYEGTVMIPLSQARIIRQGNASLFVPLLRVRIDGVGEEALVKTFVIGQGVPDGGRVSPFRLDDGPRSYEPIAARALD